jgi:hypothetical protein
MNWIHHAPSALWQWIGLVAGLLGLAISIMALPTVLQMLWGRPKPSVEFQSNRASSFVSLQCHIANAPIRSRVLRRIGITRQATKITTAIRVSEQGTGKLLVADMVSTSNGLGGPSSDISELTNVWPLVVAPIGWLREESNPSLHTKAHTQPIAEGNYVVEITVRTEHGLRRTFRKNVHIGRNPDEMYWTI